MNFNRAVQNTVFSLKSRSSFYVQAMQYPTESDLDSCLKNIASQAGDATAIPFRTNMVRLHGKPPMYSVVILSPAREPLRQRLGQILARNFSLGVTSLMLSVSDVQALMAHCKHDVDEPGPQ